MIDNVNIKYIDSSISGVYHCYIIISTNITCGGTEVYRLWHCMPSFDNRIEGQVIIVTILSVPTLRVAEVMSRESSVIMFDMLLQVLSPDSNGTIFRLCRKAPSF